MREAYQIGGRIMSKITLSAEAASLLAAVTTKSELYAPDGRRIGYFIPPDQAALLEEHPALDLFAEPTLEQLKASDAAGGGIPHEEVVKRLGLE
jgi:hypothetical protein